PLRRSPDAATAAIRPLRLQGQLQSQLHLSRREAGYGFGRPDARLGRHGLPRTRPGADPASSREPSRRFHLALHAAGAFHPAWAATRRLYRRVARLPTLASQLPRTNRLAVRRPSRGSALKDMAAGMMPEWSSPPW